MGVAPAGAAFTGFSTDKNEAGPQRTGLKEQREKGAYSAAAAAPSSLLSSLSLDLVSTLTTAKL